MRHFLDTSVLLAVSGSAGGASREIFRPTESNGWTLVTTPYAIDEVLRNLPEFPPTPAPNGSNCGPGFWQCPMCLRWIGPRYFLRERTVPSSSAPSLGRTFFSLSTTEISADF